MRDQLEIDPERLTAILTAADAAAAIVAGHNDRIAEIHSERIEIGSAHRMKRDRHPRYAQTEESEAAYRAAIEKVEAQMAVVRRAMREAADRSDAASRLATACAQAAYDAGIRSPEVLARLGRERAFFVTAG
ncbi:hypothetical protein [Paracoccus sanguinis]|uniref:hypothetical protein n=1 Tax=Paracoccus sanguinis TaxID=1545044 RepID=UPI00051FEB3C|nr:hypothetical protein [Paracoccus sanguinis]KGJ15126.1 hypothetical protein IX54_03360 [Paracoccus sanguinis]